MFNQYLYVMKAYEQSCITEINYLLNALKASNGLRTNVIQHMVKASTSNTGYYQNIVINALRLGLELQKGNTNIGHLAPMQSGKTDTMSFLGNFVLPAIGYLKAGQNALFVTSMRDTDLYEQNLRNLEEDYYDYASNSWEPSKVRVLKIDQFFKHPNPFRYVKNYGIKLVLRDEDQYGAGEDSTFDSGFFNLLRKQLPEMPLVSVSATPFDILDAKEQGYKVSIVEGVRPPNYFGITEMLKNNMIEDLPANFEAYTESVDASGNTVLKLGAEVSRYVKYLLGFDAGLGIIRVTKTNYATQLRNIINNRYSSHLDCLVIGSLSTCDYKIQEGIQEVKNRVLSRERRVVLIVIQALSAGKDFRLLKEKIRFAIEPRKLQLANGSQGLPGRICGYHNNRTFKLMAPIALLKQYSAFEQDYEVFTELTWRNGLFNNGVKGISTQVKLEATQKQKTFKPIISVDTLDHKTLITTVGRKKLSFLDDAGYQKLMDAFLPKVFNSTSKAFKLNDRQKKTTMRLASSYTSSDNRVFKYWNCKVNDDFGNIVFKTGRNYKYGLLIINYPETHAKNTKGFCGVKIIEAGKKITKNQISSTSNDSMYPA